MAEAIPDFTPLILVTGFLGSGKTTLLRRILADPAFADTAVIINEFGEIGLDHDLVAAVADDVVLLPSGCLCCALKGELAASLRDLHARRSSGQVPPFRRVVVETTGLADPYPILSTVKADPVLRHHFRIGAVVTTVDAVNGSATLDRHVEAVRQAAVADTIVLTKTDIADGAATQGLVARLADLNPAASIVSAEVDGRDLGRLFEPSAHAGAWFKAAVEPAASDAPVAHAASIRSISIVIGEPLDWTAFGIWLTMLTNRHGARILRVKGILSLIGEPLPVAVHGVQHLVHPPQHLAEWPDDERRSRLVFILDGIEPETVRRSLAAFLL